MSYFVPSEPIDTSTPPPSDPLVTWAREAGWTEDRIPELIRVIRGGSNCPNGESSGHPDSENGQYKGLLQISTPFWFDVFHEDPSAWADPVTNLRVGRYIFEYEFSRYGDGWLAWECKP